MTSIKHLEKVAIVGGSGNIGAYILKELLKTGKHTITAITRHDSTGTFASGVNVTRVDFSDSPSLISALSGHDFLVIALTARAPPDLHSKIVKAAVDAGIQYIMPNCYGADFLSENLRNNDVVVAGCYKNAMEVQELGANYVALCCGFWYEWGLALGESFFGFDIKNRKATFFDDGHTMVTVSTFEQCGRALAALLSLPVNRGDNNTGSALEQWNNQTLRIYSFHISQKDMLNSLHRVLGTKGEDWEIRYESSAQRVKDGLEELRNGIRNGFAKSMYSRLFSPNGDGDLFNGAANEDLNLPKEDLDEATRRAVKMVEIGWNPY